jgi:hypothetical protein
MRDGMQQEEDPGFAALGGGMEEQALALPEERGEGVSTEVLVRDLLIFQLKLFMDGVKDLVLSPLSILAVLWDLVPSRKGYRGRAFYHVLKIGERYDLWLNLYTPARDARVQGEGLLEAGVHSADSLVGKLEELARQEASRQKLKADRDRGRRPG